MATWLGTPELLALAAALGWASGIRLYAVVFLVGASGYLGWIDLPQGLKVLQHPAVLGAAGFMGFVEFFADKIAVIDTLWDLMHTVIRIPAGAALAAAAFGAEGGEAMTWVAALLGGSLAATAHTAKLATRAAVNTSPEPFSNVGVSLLEDGFVVFMLWLAAAHPLIFGITLALCIVLAVVLVVLLFKFLRAAVRKLDGLFAGPSRPQGS